MKRMILVSLILAMVASACGRSNDSVALPNGPQVVLSVDTVGPGLYHPVDLLRPSTPNLFLYSDGRLVMMDEINEVTASYRLGRIKEGSIREVLVAATAAGLFGPDRDLGFSGIADGSTAIVTVHYDQGMHVTTADGLWEEGFDAAVSPQQAEARRELRRFVESLRRPGEWWVPGTAAEPWIPSTWSALWSPAPAELPFEPIAKPWPLESLAAVEGVPVREGATARCAVVDDLLAARLLTQLQPETVWDSEGILYYLYLRPLLPHEGLDCAAASL